jgi:hypothetical protein
LFAATEVSMVDYAIATAKCGLAVVALHHPIIETD